MADAVHDETLDAYARYLQAEEKAPATIEKYLRDIGAFIHWLTNNAYGGDTSQKGSAQRPLFGGASANSSHGRVQTLEDENAGLLAAGSHANVHGHVQAKEDANAELMANVTNETITSWKRHLQAQNLAPSTVNGKLAALNSYFAFLGRGDLRARFLKIQRRVFRDPARDITRKDYKRLLTEARRRKLQTLSLVMETICATGMRVSELAFLTVEALANLRVDVALKGKIRTIFLPKKLRAKLARYANVQKIKSGPIFLNAEGRVLTRHSIWAQMKALARKAHVNATKVFPHNLRHLFAQTFYAATNDIVKLADVLGYSSIETTRIYLRTSGREYGQLLERLNLVA